VIGSGSFGVVHLGIDLHTGQEVAVKVMPKQRGKLSKERTLQKLVKEVGILHQLQVRWRRCWRAALRGLLRAASCCCTILHGRRPRFSPPGSADLSSPHALQTETQHTQQQDCPNTVRLLGCFESDDEVQLVTELCTGGDLQKLSDVSALGGWGWGVMYMPAADPLACSRGSMQPMHQDAPCSQTAAAAAAAAAAARNS